MADGSETPPIDDNLIELATAIISAYVANNSVQSAELPDLIRNVHGSLQSLTGRQPTSFNQKPAVSVRKSLTDEYLICLEDGKKFKSLKRHLRAKYNLSPEEYRKKWGLAPDYPMVAPSYARQRSDLAKEMGLGRAKTEA